MDMSLDICFQWYLKYCFLSRSVGTDAIRKDAFLVTVIKISIEVPPFLYM